MRQLTFIRPGRFEWWDVPAPRLQADTDAIVRPLAVTRCDLDLYIATGTVPLPGPFAFGHEMVGRIVEIGDEVRDHKIGDRVIVPFQLSCGRCGPCLRGHTNACEAFPFRSAYGLAPLNGTDHGGALSDAIRVPFADHMLVAAPEGIGSEALAGLGDNVTDGFRAVAEPLQRRPGAQVLVAGGLAQGVGLYAVQSALALGASRVVYADWAPERLALAKALGAEVRQVTYKASTDPAAERFPITVEASGHPHGANFAAVSTEACGVCTLVASPVAAAQELPLKTMYGQGIELRVGRVQARATLPAVLDCVCCGRLRPEALITKRVRFEDAAEAMDDPTPKLVLLCEDA